LLMKLLRITETELEAVWLKCIILFYGMVWIKELYDGRNKTIDSRRAAVDK